MSLPLPAALIAFFIALFFHFLEFQSSASHVLFVLSGLDDDADDFHPVLVAYENVLRKGAPVHDFIGDGGGLGQVGRQSSQILQAAGWCRG